MWTTPSATEMRFGFEVTMYVCNKQENYYEYVIKTHTIITYRRYKAVVRKS